MAGFYQQRDKVYTLGQRRERLEAWARQQLGWPEAALTPASADASFRRYFRIQQDAESYILMDAPPDREDCRPFVHISRLFLELGLHVPQILAEDAGQGFLLLSDLGSRLYLDELDAGTVHRLYGDALGALATLQSCGPVADLPPYDRKLLLFEMSLFRDWLLETHLEMTLNDAEQAQLQLTFEVLADNALEQPAVCVHRDYHSRNLMVSDYHNPGILDYQDAVIGPITYDLASLLRDCYISWPRQLVEEWAVGYYELAQQTGILRPGQARERQFLRWFDLMGVQRHLKAAGIFARLNHRDGKPGYLGDIPRTLGYVKDVCTSYTELEDLGRLTERVLAHL
jgi:aminoglycoside/choline kinase family phosphotransferase